MRRVRIWPSAPQSLGAGESTEEVLKEEQETDGRRDFLKCHEVLSLFSPVLHLKESSPGVLSQIDKKRARVEKGPSDVLGNKGRTGSIFLPLCIFVKHKINFKTSLNLLLYQQMAAFLPPWLRATRRGGDEMILAPMCDGPGVQQGHSRSHPGLGANKPNCPSAVFLLSRLQPLSGDLEGCIKHGRGGGGCWCHRSREASGAAVQRSAGSGSAGCGASAGTLRRLSLRPTVLAVVFIFAFRVGLSSLTTKRNLIFLLIRR